MSLRRFIWRREQSNGAEKPSLKELFWPISRFSSWSKKQYNEIQLNSWISDSFGSDMTSLNYETCRNGNRAALTSFDSIDKLQPINSAIEVNSIAV